ncbi:MAG TPA: vitamin K epoxide reductase family protein [Anaerolineales bacterium]
MDKRLSQIAIALTIIGLLVSIYMTIYKITSNDSMCIGSQDCSVVNASRYSEIYGIPVAVLGVVGYTAILAVLGLERSPGFFQQNGSMLFFGLSLVGFLFTLYLIFLEVVLIKAYCPFCIASQAAMTLIFILAVVRLVRQPYFQED